MVLPANGDDPRQLGAGEVLAGSAKWQDILPLQAGGLLSTLLGVDNIVYGSDFVWNVDYLPTNRSIYLETFASGSALTTLVAVTLYATSGPTSGQAVVNATTSTTNTTTGALVRSNAFTLVDGVSYQLRFKATLLGTATLKLARLIFI